MRSRILPQSLFKSSSEGAVDESLEVVSEGFAVVTEEACSFVVAGADAFGSSFLLSSNLGGFGIETGGCVAGLGFSMALFYSSSLQSI